VDVPGGVRLAGQTANEPLALRVDDRLPEDGLHDVDVDVDVETIGEAGARMRAAIADVASGYFRFIGGLGR
jgi:hypothetical protein